MTSFNEDNKRNVAIVLENILNPENNIPQNIKMRVIREMLWSATADYQSIDDHKYKLPIWSENAIYFFQEWLNNGNTGLRHEHIFPKNLIINKLTNMQNLNVDDIYILLHRFAHGAVVTTDEDRYLNNLGLRQAIPENYNPNVLPLEGDYLELLFSRYIQAGINLKFVTFQGNEIMPTDNYYIHNGNVLVNNFINNINFENWIMHNGL